MRYFIYIFFLYSTVLPQEFPSNLQLKLVLEEQKVEYYKNTLRSVYSQLLFVVPRTVFMNLIVQLPDSFFDYEFFKQVIERLPYDVDHALLTFIFLYTRSNKNLQSLIILHYITRTVQERDRQIQKKLYKQALNIPVDLSCFESEVERIGVQLFFGNAKMYAVLDDIRSIVKNTTD